MHKRSTKSKNRIDRLSICNTDSLNQKKKCKLPNLDLLKHNIYFRPNGFNTNIKQSVTEKNFDSPYRLKLPQMNKPSSFFISNNKLELNIEGLYKKFSSKKPKSTLRLNRINMTTNILDKIMVT